MAKRLGLTRVAPEVWDRLVAERVSGDALVARLALPEKSTRVLAAQDSEGRRHLLIALGTSEAAFDDRKSRGIEVATRKLRLMDGTEARYLDLLCHEPFGFDVFDTIGGELALAMASGIEEPAKAVQRLITKWRHFWLFQSTPTLSREQQIGLFAELWFLAFWLIPLIGSDRAVEAWRGPLGSRHDVELPQLSVEVKATTSATGRIHFIHGIEQLEAPEGGQLLLFSLLVRDEGGGLNTLQSLVDRIRSLASADDETIVKFETRLVQSGYSDVSVDQTLRLRVVDERLYTVNGTFPRLTPDVFAPGVPAGVQSISYAINLSGFDEYVAAARPDEWRLI